MKSNKELLKILHTHVNLPYEPSKPKKLHLAVHVVLQLFVLTMVAMTIIADEPEIVDTFTFLVITTLDAFTLCVLTYLVLKALEAIRNAIVRRLELRYYDYLAKVRGVVNYYHRISGFGISQGASDVSNQLIKELLDGIDKTTSCKYLIVNDKHLYLLMLIDELKLATIRY